MTTLADGLAETVTAGASADQASVVTLLRRLVRISHDQRITSIADLLSSRFGKSSRLGVLVTSRERPGGDGQSGRLLPRQDHTRSTSQDPLGRDR